MKKYILFSLTMFAMISCKDSKKQAQQEVNASQAQTTVEQTANLDWLLGNWKRTNDKEGRLTFEYWNKTSPSQYDGIGYTLAQGDTLSKEYMRLVQTDGHWNLVVKTSEDADTVEFKMTELKENSFVCVNESHDFPTHIAYKIESDTLKAIVSNKEMAIDFEFVSIK